MVLRRQSRASLKQRGTAYVLVLAITTLLVAMGVAGVMLARQNLKRSDLYVQQLQAAEESRNGLELVSYRVNGLGVGLWRSIYTSGGWVNDSPAGQLTLSYMFVDENDGDLADDPAQDVRLYVRADYGKATRIYSMNFSATTGALVAQPDTFRQELTP